MYNFTSMFERAIRMGEWLAEKFHRIGRRGVLWGVLLFFIFGLAGAGGVLWYLGSRLPPLDSLRGYEPSLATRVYSGEGRLIGQFYIEKRVFVPLSRIPKELFQAVIAVEDSRFYEHGGYDLFGIVRALITNIESFKIRQGGSTITQQLARSLFLTPEKSLARKIKEILLARRIEKILTKDEILELYLNQVYFGHGAYGVQMAARTYFGKDVDQLTLAESSLLAGLPKAPSDYSPYHHPQKAKQRQAVVLRRMVEEGFITEQQYQEAYALDIVFQNPLEEDLAPYFLEYVRQYLISRYGEENVYRGGLSVYTTLNIEMQKAAHAAVREGLRHVDKRQGYRGPLRRVSSDGSSHEGEEGAVKKKDLHEGEILEGEVTAVFPDSVEVVAGGFTGKILFEDLAWAAKKIVGQDLQNDVTIIPHARPSDIVSVGDIIKVGVKKAEKEVLFTLEQDPLVEGALLALDPTTGAVLAMVGGYDFKRSEFNRALHARRQPGSAFKPFIYATAIDLGLTPATIVVDAPVIYNDPAFDRIWKPENYEEKFFGPISLREALAYSRNLATVRLMERIGVRNVIAFCRKVGITSPLNVDLSLSLGSSSLSLLEIVSGFGVFANGGVRVDPMPILSVVGPDGTVLERHDPQPRQVISRETAYLITNMMEDVIQRGTGKRAKVLGRPLAGKTGTTNEYTDAWFVGFAPNIVAGVWVGFDDVRSLGEKEAGATAALPIWMSFMRKALEQLPIVSFSIPDDIIFAKIDPETGLLADSRREGGIVEVFVKGTEPTTVASHAPTPIQFFRIDSSTH